MNLEMSHPAGDYHWLAEEFRKAGRLEEAELAYLHSIDLVEDDPQWQTHGLPPASYEALAKMYYHMERDNDAIAILDRFLSQRSTGRRILLYERINRLRNRLASGNLRRSKLPLAKGGEAG